MTTPVIPVELQIVAKREPERLVFGYAVLATKRDGSPLIDLQGHHVELASLESSVYRYVERVLDRFQDVADEIQGIVIDHA